MPPTDPSASAGARAIRFRLKLVGFNLLLLVVLAEVALRFVRVDHRLIGPLLYYQAADLPVHRASRDPELLYGMRPRAAIVSEDGRRITINSLGFRDPERRVAKPPGVFRIMVLGGSNAYGAAVNDGETYAACLERLLNERAPGRFEVWNLGTCAYVPAQELVLARRAMREFSPDLLLFGPTNSGRRAFLLGSDYGPLLDANPTLYLENLRAIPGAQSVIGRALIAHSAAWRTAVIAVNRRALRLGCGGIAHQGCGPPATNPRYDSETFTSNVPFQAFWDEFGGRVPMAFMPGSPSINYHGPSPLVIHLFEYLPPGAGPEYRNWHPPAAVYRWYASVIARTLTEAGLLPGARPASVTQPAP